MTCGCITAPNDNVPALQPYFGSLTPIVWGTLQNVEIIDNQLYRDGGTPDTSDAFGYSTNFVEGTACGLWECRQFFDNDDTNQTIFMVLEDEFGTANRYGWFFLNQTVSWRRAPYHGTGFDFPIYYGPAGGDPAPDQVGYNVGFRFGIYYNNGTVQLYENQQWTNDTNDFFGAGTNDEFSYVFTGLPTDRRWRLKVYVFPDASLAHSPTISEYIGAVGDVCVDAEWPFPALEWEAEGTVVGPVTPPTIQTCPTIEPEENPLERVQRVLDFDQEIHRNIQLRLTAIAPLTLYGYSMEWVPVSVSELTEQRNAYGAVWQFLELGHLFYAYIGHISTADLELTITVDAGTAATSTDAYTIPHTGGTFRKDWVVLRARKGKLFDITIHSDEELQIVVEQSVLFGKEFKSSGGYQPLRAFGDHT